MILQKKYIAMLVFAMTAVSFSVFLIPSHVFASVAYDNVTGLTPQNSTPRAGGFINTFVAGASGDISDLFAPISYASGFSSLGSSMNFTIGGGSYGSDNSELSCGTATKTMSDWGFIDGSYPPSYTPVVDITGWTGTNCTLVVGHSYYIHSNISSGTRSPGVVENSDPLYIIWTNGSGAPSDTSTHISSVTPENNAVISTSTPSGGIVSFNATGYLNASSTPNDFSGNSLGARVKWSAYSVTQAATSASVAGAFSPQGAGYTSYSDTLYGSASVDTSTSSPLMPYGRYNLTTSIVVPNQFFGIVTWGDTTLVSTTTTFYLGTSTPLDNLFYGTDGSPDLGTALSGGIIATSSAALFAACSPNPLTFSFGDCMSIIFVPDWTQLTQVFTSLRDGMLSVWPIGYVTRFITIASGNATTTLPSLVINFATAPPAIASITSSASLDLTPWNDLMGTTSMLSEATSTDSGRTFRQIVEPGWDIFVWVSFAILIIFELMGIPSQGGFGARGALSDTNSGDDSYRLKEKLYSMSKRK
jgi:hypothetical protein